MGNVLRAATRPAATPLPLVPDDAASAARPIGSDAPKLAHGGTKLRIDDLDSEGDVNDVVVGGAAIPSVNLEADAHVLFAGTTNWGHLRPMLSLALNLCTLFPNLHVTFFAPATSTSLTSPASGSALSPSPSLSNGKEKAATPGVVEREIALFQPSEDVLRRFRVVPLGHRSPSSSSTPTPPPVSAPTTETKSAGDIQLEEVSRRRKAWSGHVNAFLEDLPGALRALRKTRECEAGSVCGVNGKVIEGERGFARRPTLFVADLLLGALPDTVARTAADPSSDFRSLPILSFSPTPAAWNVRRMQAGGGKRYEALRADPANAGLSDDELLEKAYTYTDGSLVTIAGNQPVYDYELQPQLGAVPFEPHMTRIVQEATKSLLHPNVAGIVIPTSPELEPDVDKILAGVIGGECLQVGPQFPERWWREDLRGTSRLELSRNDAEVLAFLDDKHRRFGANSVVYISFGSEYSPSKRPDLLETLVTTLLTPEDPDNPLPFIFATATTTELFSPELYERVQKSGIGWFTRFAPQQLVLQHPATGWFLTHAGSNSVSEAILNSVPMILWPCMTDQPIAANQLVLNHQIAIELIQVRTGPSTGKPTYRGVQHLGGTRDAVEAELRDVFARLRPASGSEGEREAIRRRMEEMHRKYLESWAEGSARAAMLRFAEWF